MTLRVIVDHSAERGAVRVHPADKNLMDRAALAIDNSQPGIVDDAAKIIDRLLMTVRGLTQHTSNSTDAAYEWLRQHDHPTLWLNAETRHVMEST